MLNSSHPPPQPSVMSTKKKKGKKGKAIVVPAYLVGPMEALVAPKATEASQMKALRVRRVGARRLALLLTAI